MTGQKRRGWAKGWSDSGEWLTIAISALEAPALYDTEAEANRLTSPGDTVAYVVETFLDGMTGPRQYAYRILCAKPGHQDHPVPCQACRTEREGG